MTAKGGVRRMRWWVPLGLVAVVMATLGVLYARQDVSRYLATALLPVLVLFLVGLWYIFLTQLPWRRRWGLFGGWLLVAAGAAGALIGMTRWEGSLSGGALPRLVWRWSPELDARLAQLEGRGGQASGVANQASFTQFLGPNRNGVLEGPRLDPDWNAHPPKELWRREIGAGWSGFSVRDGRAITQEQRGESELVSCYDLLTGEPLWVHADQARFEEAMGGDGPRANPTIHEGVVYAMGATGILNCLDFQSGRLVWSRHILDDHSAGNVMYGKACSPLIVDDLVVVTGGQLPGPTLLAYHRQTGDLVWTAGEDAASYASPIVATLAGERHIVSVNQNTVTGHDPATGEVRWSWDWPARMPKSALAQPVGGNRLLVSASYGMGTALLEVSKSGAGWEVAKVWKKLQMKTKFSNVCLLDGHAYGLDEGRLACVEVATGQRRWRGNNYGYGQNLLVGDLLVIQSERGAVALVRATPERFEELASLDALSAKTWNNPTVAGKFLLVRNDREAICYRLKVQN